MADNAVGIEERAANLPTPDRQCVISVSEDWYTSNYDRIGTIDLIDVFTDGEPDYDTKTSSLGLRSYIEDIMIPAKSWESLYR